MIFSLKINKFNFYDILIITYAYLNEAFISLIMPKNKGNI